MTVTGEVRDMLCAHDYKIEYTRKSAIIHESTQEEDPNESDPGKRGKDSVIAAQEYVRQMTRAGSIALEMGSESTFQDQGQTNTGFCEEGEIADQPIDPSTSTRNLPSIMVAPSRSTVIDHNDTF